MSMERALSLTTARLGGRVGAPGMKAFHRRTQHWDFKGLFPVLLIAQMVLLAFGANLLALGQNTKSKYAEVA